MVLSAQLVEFSRFFTLASLQVFQHFFCISCSASCADMRVRHIVCHCYWESFVLDVLLVAHFIGVKVEMHDADCDTVICWHHLKAFVYSLVIFSKILHHLFNFCVHFYGTTDLAGAGKCALLCHISYFPFHRSRTLWLLAFALFQVLFFSKCEIGMWDKCILLCEGEKCKVLHSISQIFILVFSFFLLTAT